MSDSLPPTYSRFSLPAAYECGPVPTYTELAHTSERVLHSAPASPVTSRDTICHPAYTYRTDHLEVDLGRSPWSLQYAAYGKGGVITGSVKFTKKCTHVAKVTVTLLGYLITKASEHPLVAVPQVFKTCLVSKTMTLHSTAFKKSETVPADKTYFFTIPFPEQVKDHPGMPLPPTFTTFHPAAITDVEYSLQVDVVRKGLHRHEMFTIPVLYFPKSQPLVPEVPEDFLESPSVMSPLDKRVKQITVQPKFREGSCLSMPLDDVPSVNLLLPSSGAFASGSTIPVSLVVMCPSSPALAQALSAAVGLFLVKRKKLWVNGGRQISVREQLVHKAETFRMTELSEHEKYLSLQLKVGEPGCEYSFKVDGALEVEYFVRLIIRPPPYLKHLPVFQHDQPINVTTDQHGTLERELLMMGGVPMPALGLASPALRRTVRIGSC
ncbi:hypothetical protein QCA50_002860 [Cerrena zonata]|uniref:Arrestin-like N-terminal domain-containing protein n=1 Tax=Cerrena zonata TaxID=2478898 RepID=A0AAW0GIX6_9APHY